MKNIHLLPTNKPSRLYKNISDELSFTSIEFTQQDNGFNINQHIYITSDEEIKEGGWCFDIFLDAVFQANWFMGIKTKNTARKIILTTDKDLIKDGVQAIDEEFLEWFVKNPNCIEVEIELYDGEFIETKGIYKIIIPKEETKCSCKVGEPYNNVCCKVHGSIPQEELKQGYSKSETEFLGIEFTLKDGSKQFVPKQETLEEDYLNQLIDEANKEFTLDRKLAKDVAIKYAEWQAERSQKIVPFDAYNIEVFSIKPDESGRLFAYIGYNISNGNFHFSSVPFTDPQYETIHSDNDMIKFMQFIVSQETLGNTSAVSEKTAKYYLEQFKKKNNV